MQETTTTHDLQIEHPFEAGQYKVIYAFSRSDTPKLQGMLKVGDTLISADDPKSLSEEQLRSAALKRISSYTKTALVDIVLEYAELALIEESDGTLKTFRDHDVHKVLKLSGYEKFKDDQNSGQEWFKDITAADVRAAVSAVKEGESYFDSNTAIENFELYPHQRDAVDKTLATLEGGTIEIPKRMLWNAKMRFGKTIAAYSYAEEADLERVLVITHRPDVNASWFDDFKKLQLPKKGWRYGSKRNGDKLADLLTVDSFGQTVVKEGKLLWFASIQDLRLSKGSDPESVVLKKNSELFDVNWDLIITDEAHEGTLTELANSMYDSLKSTRFLDLSGTPFNILQAGSWDFDGAHRYLYDGTFIWSYPDEQRAKREWDEEHPGDPNPWGDFPSIEFRTYNLGNILSQVKDGAYPSIEFNDLFAVGSDGKFVREDEVRSFLYKLLGSDRYSSIAPESFPFHKVYQDQFAHTLWMLPSVAAVGAMEELLNEPSSGFSGWTVVNATGVGNSTVEAEDPDALKRVRLAVKDRRSITLSFRMLTTGISVPEWTAVFMMSNISSPMGYMQAAFRATTPGTLPNGSQKTKAYVFDFSADRCLKAIADLAKSSAKSSRDPIEQHQHDLESIDNYLEFVSLLSLDGAHFVEPDSEAIMERLNEAYRDEVVDRGFDSPRLFNFRELQQFSISQKVILDAMRKLQGSSLPGSVQDIVLSDKSEEQREKDLQELKELQDKAKDEAKGQLPEPDKKRLEELTKSEDRERKLEAKNRQNGIKIVTGVACRLPMLVFASNPNVKITPQNFHLLIDDESWAEFMPNGLIRVKPEGVGELSDREDEALGAEGGVIYWEDVARFFDPVIFSLACERIRQLARLADSKDPLERAFRIAALFSSFKNPDKETVLTPWRVVNLQYASTVGGFVSVDLERSTAKDVYLYVQDLNTGELESLPTKIALAAADNGTHRLSAVWMDPAKLSDEAKAAADAIIEEDGTGDAVADPLIAEAASVALPSTRAEAKAQNSSKRNAADFWAQEDLSVYDINSKTALYPLFAALSRFYVERLKVEGKPLPKHGDILEPSALPLASEREIWREVIEKNIFLNCRVDYSVSIAQRVLMGFNNTQTVNATSIDVLELKQALEWWNAGGDAVPQKKGARKSSYMPDWWQEIEDVYSVIGAALRLANSGFVRYYSPIGVRAQLANSGYSQQNFQNILETILLSKSQGEESSMGKKADEKSADGLNAVRELLEIVDASGELPRFDLTAGNPPYQITEEGADSKRGGKQGKIYPLFWLTSLEMSRASVMVFPDGWRFASGKGSIYEAPRMRDNIHLVDVYPLGGTAFEAGISVDVVHSDSEFTNNGSINRHFMQTPKIWQRLSKIYSSTESVFNGQRNNGLSGEGEFVERKKGHPDHIHESEVPNSLKVYHGRVMRVFWVDRDHPNFKPTNRVKLILPSTGASRAFRDSHVIQAHEEYSDYWFSAFFDTEDQAKNFRLYLGTKLYRHLHDKGAVSQNATKSTHKFVPNLEDYSSNNALFSELPEDESEAIQKLDERLTVFLSISEEEATEIYGEQNES